MFWNELRLEAAMSVTRYLDGQFTELTLERLVTLAITSVACGVGDRIVLGVNPVFRSVGIEYTLRASMLRLARVTKNALA